MEARLVKILLRCVQADADRFSVTVALDNFVIAYGPRVGIRKGQSIYMDATQKQTIRGLLASIGVNADTPPDAWEGLTRAEALQLGRDEKFAHDPVRRRRVVIKSLSSKHPLILNGHPLFLPDRCHVEVDYAEVGRMEEHDWIVVVENWESFNDIHFAAANLFFHGANPLILWRGDKDNVRSNDMLAMIRALNQPVAAFVDYDPAGMVIARSLPRLQHIVAPPLDEMAGLMATGLHDRYMEQIAVYGTFLEQPIDDCVAPVWEVIRRSGRALPQERFAYHHKVEGQ